MGSPEVKNYMTDIKFIKACPFLRDLSDSYLCVNNDDVVDVILDPLIDIEWSEELTPVASEVEDMETCLFTLEIKEDGRLYCISREMFLVMDGREILWEDIRDSFFLLKLDNLESAQNADVDFCSTCLYKVLIASSPIFQKKLDFKEKIKLGTSYILNRANKISSNLIELSEEYSKQEKTKQQKEEETKKDTTAFQWLLWIYNDIRLDDEFIASAINWVQKFDEWTVIVSKIADEKSEEMKVRLVEESYNYAAKLKEISYELVIKMAMIKEKELDTLMKNTEKIFTVASILFEDYMFICNQFLDIIKGKI